MQEIQGENGGCFGDARWALFWSADVLRRRCLPKISAFWRESGGVPDEGEGADLTAAKPDTKTPLRGIEKNLLPDDGDSRQALALKVEDILRGLGAHGMLLRQMAWGDGWSEASLNQALAHREKARRAGLRLRINYRYTYRQLAALHDCDPKAVWRQVRAALTAFAAALEQAGLLWQAEKATPIALRPAGKLLKARDFKTMG